MLLFGDARQPLFEPICKFVISSFSLGDTCYEISHSHSVFSKLIATSCHQQYNDIQGCTLVPIRESMIGDNAM